MNTETVLLANCSIYHLLFQNWTMNYFSNVEHIASIKSVQSTLSHLIMTSVPRAMFTHFLMKQCGAWTISILFILNGFAWGVELHNLLNFSNSLLFRVETFKLSQSMKSQLNVNSSSLKRI